MSFPVSTRQRYDMFSAAGNRACQRLVQRLLARTEELGEPNALMAAAAVGLDSLSAKFEEVWDTEPRDHVFYEAVLPIAKYHGFTDKVSRYL